MRLSQKRTCQGCKAGWYEINPFHQHCELGVKVKSENRKGIPQEPCYKPTTYSDYLIARDLVL